jgi:glycine/D-amino acid oxidase-like deaminating enzyme
VAAVTALLRSVVPARGAEIREEAQIRAITRSGGGWQVQTGAGPVESDVLVITAGLGTNELLELIPGCPVRFPLSPDRPVQSKYFRTCPRSCSTFPAPCASCTGSSCGPGRTSWSP